MATPLTSELATNSAHDRAVNEREEHDRPTIIIDGSTQWRRWVADLSLYYGALKSLAWRNVRSRYKQAVLGMAWALVQPTVQVVVFTVVFGMMARVPTGDLPYPLFALPGLLLWNLFARIVGDGSVSLVANQALITKLYFPRIYLVLAAGASAIVDLCVSLVLLIGVMIAYGHLPGLQALLAIPVLGGVLVLAFGTAAFLSSLNARWRDIQHTIPFVLQIGLFVTPVLYENRLIPDRWQWLLAMNPMTGFISVFRSALLSSDLPPARTLLVSLATSAVVIIVGLLLFRRSESTVVDVV